MVMVRSPKKKQQLSESDRERGRRIRALRDSLHESQTAFGDRFAVEQATVSRWEQGEPVTRSLWDALAKTANQSVAEFMLGAQQAVPLLSWVAAGEMTMVQDVPEPADAPMIPVSALGPGEWFALKVEGDSMDRIAPDGAVILINHAEKTLIPKKFYIFGDRGAATFKRYIDKPARLEPYSTNPGHEAIFPGKDLHVIGRVRRVLIDL